ncbi:hypothetical protein J4Q44_G00225650 [Coregonus suidteri]|uniref:Uncharacterized protein n=1 Tax=Coregonus suidteri TaxID=861788 RepID=A0AAN8QZG7_9TELE
MTNLEKQFGDLKDQLYKDRLSQVDAKLQEVIAGKASEYLDLWQICRRTCRSEQRLRSSGMMSCSQGRTRGKIHLVQTKIKSQLCQTSYFIIQVSTEISLACKMVF